VTKVVSRTAVPGRYRRSTPQRPLRREREAAAALGVEQRREDARVVELRETEPVDHAVAGDESRPGRSD